jgi:hypothetical protein
MIFKIGRIIILNNPLHRRPFRHSTQAARVYNVVDDVAGNVLFHEVSLTSTAASSLRSSTCSQVLASSTST